MLDEPNREGHQLEFVTLFAGGQSFCIEITQIREIRRWTPVTVLPHSPAYVLGVINLRGAVIPIIDLATKLGFGPIEASERHVIIIVAVEDTIVGLLVDSVSEILSVDHAKIKDTPQTNDAIVVGAVSGIIARENDMTKVLNLRHLLPMDEMTVS